MPDYEVTSPTGKKFIVTAPDGATQAQILDYAKKNMPQEAQPQQKRSLLGAIGEGISNVPDSAVKFAGDLVTPFLHPMETAEGLGNLGLGVLEKLGVKADAGHKKYAEAVGQMLVDRWGGWDNIKNTLATDPVGFMADASMVLGGGSAALRATGMAGKTERAIHAASRATDPLVAAKNAIAKPAGYVASEIMGGPITNTGGEAIRGAYLSGYEGGVTGKGGGNKGNDFLKAQLGMTGPEQIVGNAQKATDNLARVRNAEYARDIKKLNKSPTILSWNDVDRAIDDMDKVANYRGRSGTGPSIGTNDAAAEMRQKIKEKIAEFRYNPDAKASQYWTVEGFDRLKQAIGNIATSDEQALKVRTEIFNAIKDTIIKQDPEYGKIMEAYSQAAKQITELKKTMSMKHDATTDTALRKLLSAMRDNVNTNFGRRKQLADKLKTAGYPNIMEELSGMSLGGAMPHGLAKLFMTGETGALLFTHPYLIPLVAAHSPLITGLTTHAAGRVAGTLSKLKPIALPASRIGAAQDAMDDQGSNRAKAATRITVHPRAPAEVLDQPSGIPLE